MYIKTFFFFLVLLLLHACTPNRLEHYAHEFDHNMSTPYWNALLVSPEEYPADTLLKPLRFQPFLYKFQKQNPGFIDLAKFSKKLPTHELARLKHWYSAYFFQKDKTLNYMVMEFITTTEAQAYLTLLRSNKDEDALKILRLHNLIIISQIRNMNNELLTKTDAASLYEWILTKQSQLSSEL